MHTKPNNWWDWHNWRTWVMVAIATVLVITGVAYAPDMFGGSGLPDTGSVTITEPAAK